MAPCQQLYACACVSCVSSNGILPAVCACTHELVYSNNSLLQDTGSLFLEQARGPHNGEQGGEAEGHGDAQVCGGCRR